MVLMMLYCPVCIPSSSYSINCRPMWTAYVVLSKVILDHVALNLCVLCSICARLHHCPDQGPTPFILPSTFFPFASLHCAVIVLFRQLSFVIVATALGCGQSSLLSSFLLLTVSRISLLHKHVCSCVSGEHSSSVCLNP